ncbi:MAG: diacylglycerol kinase family lipid kinase [Verrucomicrobiales bacterium]|nr:diacylglycerol kinase family lipid kinase [Verrucomicrobiales bacterium]
MESSPQVPTSHPKPEKVHVVVNPAPSRKIPLLAILNQEFRDAGIHWDISPTHGDGDGGVLARKAIDEGATVVAAYGGDGTVMEVAAALVGTDIPLLILPGGTGNLVAAELRIPDKLEKACDLVCKHDEFKTRLIDVGMINGKPFLLRVGCGFETDVVQDATRDLKDQFGKWAYVFAGIKALQDAEETRYEIKMDDREKITERGVALAVANAGAVGLGRVTLSPEVDVDDGLLDVFLLKKANLEGMIQLARQMMGLEPNPLSEVLPFLDASELVNHWTATDIQVASDPPREIQVDGDLVDITPAQISVEPSALRVVVAG